MIKSRIAPTPSGYLHWGNLLNFSLAWRETRISNGILQLRIDDLDSTRSRPEYIEDIFHTLNWLGFDWDDGPTSPDDFVRNHSQSARKEIYREWLPMFPGYACCCSRQEIRARTEKTYDGHCRDLGLELISGVTQWRARENGVEEDIVLWRKDDLPAYHLVSLIEDIAFGTTLIVRGADLLESTQAQLRLANWLGEDGEAFKKVKFIHHPLLLDEAGHKMSKSSGATSLKHCRESGMLPSDVFAELSRRAGWDVEATNLHDLLDTKQFPLLDD